MSWVLVLYIYAGVWAKGDSVALHSVGGFASQAECAQAGKLAQPLTKDTAKEYRFVCIQQGR